jgi:hypothetical protein
MKKRLVLLISLALFVNACAKKNSPSRVGSGGGQVQTQTDSQPAEKAAEKLTPEQQKLKDEADAKALLDKAELEKAEAEKKRLADNAAAAQAATTAGAEAGAATESTSPGSTTAAATSPQAEQRHEVPDIDFEEAPSVHDHAQPDGVSVQTGSLGYTNNSLKLAEDKNRVAQVLSLGYLDKELIETAVYCYNGATSVVKKETMSQLFLLPSSQMLVQARTSSDQLEFVLNSCEALPQGMTKNFFELFRASLAGHAQLKPLNEAQKKYLETIAFVDLKVGAIDSHIEFVSSDGSLKETIKTSVVCVPQLKSKSQMREELNQDKKVKNRITLVAGSTLFLNRPIEAKDESGREIKSLPQVGGKPRVVISCKK